MSKDLRKMNLFTPGRNIQDSPYADLNQDEKLRPKPFVPSVEYLRVPFGKYHTANEVLDAYNRNNNRAMKTLALAGMANDLRKNETEMLKLIEKIPEAIKHADKSIMTDEFVQNALIVAPKAYELLQKELQQNQTIVDAYVQGMRNNCIYIERNKGEWDPDSSKRGYIDAAKWFRERPGERAAVFSCAISENCDKEQFFSVDNYRKAFESIILGGTRREAYDGDPRMHDPFPRYDSDVAYVHTANLEFANDPEKRLQYQQIEAELIETHIDYLAKQIEWNPNACKNIAEAIAITANFLEHPPAELGVEPRSGQHLIDAAIQAEKAYYISREKIRDDLSPTSQEWLDKTNRNRMSDWINEVKEIGDDGIEIGDNGREL